MNIETLDLVPSLLLEQSLSSKQAQPFPDWDQTGELASHSLAEAPLFLFIKRDIFLYRVLDLVYVYILYLRVGSGGALYSHTALVR